MSALKGLTGLAVALASMPLYGYVLKTLWWWFVVPLGVMPLGVAHAYGLSVFFAMIRNAKADKSDDDKSLFYRCAMAVMTPIVFLGIGAASHFFMVRP